MESIPQHSPVALKADFALWYKMREATKEVVELSLSLMVSN